MWAALSGPQARFAETSGAAARFPTEIAPFGAVADPEDPAGWRDLATLTDRAVLTGPAITPPPGWATEGVLTGVQMVGHGMTGVPDPAAEVLTDADVPEILDLVARARPGPFGKRTHELGRHLGLRHEGRLVATAGERLRLPGWTEVSAVCTDPGFRGRGFAARLTLAVAAGILARGDLPFLHVAQTNTAAIRLYGRLGFEAGHDVVFATVRRTGR